MDYRIKDLPQEERPREKLEKHGSSSLTEVELLSIVLRTGIQGKNVKELSGEILSSYSLQNLADRSLDDLKSFDGVSQVKAGQLKAVGELARRMQLEEKERIESFSDVKDRVRDMKFSEEEKLRVFYLSSGNEILTEEQYRGSVDSVSIDFRKLFREAVSSNASAVVVAHNHPSGRSEPTSQDIEVTEELIDAGEKLGIEVLDHVIVGKTISSMKASGAVNFST